MRLHGTILLTFILAMASCTKRQEALPYVGNPCGTDTTALNVAVLPTLSCLPVYYAQRMGMFDSAGVNVQLWRYRAQMDVDTSVLRGHVQVAMSDPFRALRLQSDTLSVAPLLAMDEPLSMIALKGKRVKHMQQMKEKMVAISRLSCTDYWCQRMITDSDIELSLIFRPQINDIFLRADMLRNGLIDAAMLPEPYATWATQEGHRRINRTKTPSLCNALWIMPHRKDEKNTHETKSILFAKGLRMSCAMVEWVKNRYRFCMACLIGCLGGLAASSFTPASCNCCVMVLASPLLLFISSHMTYLSTSQSVLSSVIRARAWFSVPSCSTATDCASGCVESKGRNQCAHLPMNLLLCSRLSLPRLGS